MKRDWRWRKQSLYSLSSFYSFFFFSLEETGREIIETSLSLSFSLFIYRRIKVSLRSVPAETREIADSVCGCCRKFAYVAQDTERKGYWNSTRRVHTPHPDEIGKIFCRDPTVNREKNSSETRIKIIDGSSSSFFFLSFFFAMLRGPNVELEKFEA